MIYVYIHISCTLPYQSTLLVRDLRLLLEPSCCGTVEPSKGVRETWLPSGVGRKTMGKPWENHGKPWENHRKTIEKWWFHGIFMGLPSGNSST